MYRIIVSTLVSFLFLAASSVPASAQTYFIREKIAVTAGPSYTYVATYSSSYGACSGGFQTQPIEKCTRNDNVVVANSFCGADKQQSSPPKICSATCGTFKAGGYVTSSYVTLRTGLGVTNDAIAKTLCEKHAADNNQVGACVRETSQPYSVYFHVNATAANVKYESYISQNAAICTK
jgi:hypothetical protein